MAVLKYAGRPHMEQSTDAASLHGENPHLSGLLLPNPQTWWNQTEPALMSVNRHLNVRNGAGPSVWTLDPHSIVLWWTVAVHSASINVGNVGVKVELKKKKLICKTPPQKPLEQNNFLLSWLEMMELCDVQIQDKHALKECRSLLIVICKCNLL